MIAIIYVKMKKRDLERWQSLNLPLPEARLSKYLAQDDFVEVNKND
jgi:hypothetical protein